MPSKRTEREVERRAHDGGFESTGDDGFFRGYAVIWDSVDSFNSVFQRGAFRKTLQERSKSIKVLWNHDSNQVIGKLISAREDDKGLLVEAQLVLDVQKAREARSLMSVGAIDGLSFAFETISENVRPDGVRNITEVRLWEVSPVTFPSNPETSIDEVRAESFGDVQAQRDISNQLFVSLDETLWNIWFSRSPTIAEIDIELSNFHAAYLSAAAKLLDMGQRAEPTRNELAAAFHAALEGRSTQQYAASSTLSEQEVELLKVGKVLPIDARARLAGHSPDLFKIHQSFRAGRVSALAEELREGGLSPAENTRLKTLLGRVDDGRTGCNDWMADAIQKLGTIKEDFNDVRRIEGQGTVAEN